MLLENNQLLVQKTLEIQCKGKKTRSQLDHFYFISSDLQTPLTLLYHLVTLMSKARAVNMIPHKVERTTEERKTKSIVPGLVHVAGTRAGRQG